MVFEFNWEERIFLYQPIRNKDAHGAMFVVQSRRDEEILKRTLYMLPVKHCYI